jgi:hypothetical protein
LTDHITLYSVDAQQINNSLQQLFFRSETASLLGPAAVVGHPRDVGDGHDGQATSLKPLEAGLLRKEGGGRRGKR